MTDTTMPEYATLIPDHPEEMTDGERFWVELLASQIREDRLHAQMEEKLVPVQEAYRTFAYGDSLGVAELGTIGNLLMGACAIIERIAMMPDASFLGYPEWERAATDAAEMRAAAKACYAELDRRRGKA